MGKKVAVTLYLIGCLATALIAVWFGLRSVMLGAWW